MAVITSAIIGAAVVGMTGAALYKQSRERLDLQKQQQKRMERQAQAAKEAANMPTNATDANADLQLGRGGGDTATTSTSQAGTGGSTSMTGAVSNRVGGLGGSTPGRATLRRRASAGVGL